MQAQRLAIDGSIVSVEVEAELGPPTAAGWVVVPSLMRAHPFVAYPPGHSRVMERAVRSNFPGIEIASEEELSLKGGTLRVGEATLPRKGERRQLVVGAWEGERGCLTTSLPDVKRDRLVEVFDTLQFIESDRGVAIDSPVVPWPRPPELVQEMRGLGVMAVRPLISSELERIPRAEGRRTRHGELFRVRSDNNTLLMLSETSVVRIHPRADADLDRLSEVVEGLRVEWTPRATRRPQR